METFKMLKAVAELIIRRTEAFVFQAENSESPMTSKTYANIKYENMDWTKKQFRKTHKSLSVKLPTFPELHWGQFRAFWKAI